MTPALDSISPSSARDTESLIGVPTGPVTASSSRFEDVSELLDWLAKRAAPLTAFILGIAAFLWTDFRREFGLPIPFASGNVLSALPAMVAIVCAAVVLLLIAMAFPAQILVTPLHRDGPRLADILQAPATKQANNPRLWLLRFWLGCAVCAVAQWIVAIAWSASHPKAPIAWCLIVVLVVILTQAAGGWWVISRIYKGQTRPDKSFYALLALMLGYQGYLGFVVLYMRLQWVDIANWQQLTTALLSMVAAMIFVAIMQVALAHRVVQGWYPNLLKHTACLTFVIMAGISLIQPMGARLASYALLSTATPRQQCSVLVIQPDPKDASVIAVLANEKENLSREFRFTYPSDGFYYLKTSSEGPTFILDAKRVIGVRPCDTVSK